MKHLVIKNISSDLSMEINKVKTPSDEKKKKRKKKKTTLGSRPIIDGSIFPVVEYVTTGYGMNVLRSDSVAETNTKSKLPLRIFGE